jgi:hypothetical protein
MTRDSEEKRIQQLYHELKSREESITPSFARSWEEARSRHRTVRPFRRALKVAAGVAAALVLLITLPLFRSDFGELPEHDLPEGYSITEWQLLTDSLLEIPCDQLLTTVPQLEYLTREMGLYPPEQDPRNNGSTS